MSDDVNVYLSKQKRFHATLCQGGTDARTVVVIAFEGGNRVRLIEGDTEVTLSPALAISLAKVLPAAAEMADSDNPDFG